MPELGEKRGTRASPQSITTRTPSIVRLVSATDVESTTLRVPTGLGAIARSCSSSGIEPISWNTVVRGGSGRSAS
jgi:hypothetical protein